MAGKRKTPRYIVMSIPGRHDDGKDTWWFMFDSKRHKSVPEALLRGESGRTKLAILVCAMNATPSHRAGRRSETAQRRH